MRMNLVFWGVRGSVATPQATHLRYGGNTSCMEVELPGGGSVVLDAGTGIRALGRQMAAAAEPQREIPLLLTHYHWDHIAGLPFFAPLYQPERLIRFYGHGLSGPLQRILEGQMASPYFPVDLPLASARKEFVEVDRKPLQVGQAQIQPFPLHHPQGARGYRIEANGAVVVYATDYEHGDAEQDALLLEYAQGADILICDAQFTAEEYPRFRGWGHSTWQNAVRVAQEAGAKQLVLFHHDPSRSDADMDQLLTEARAEFPNTEAAREGMRLAL